MRKTLAFGALAVAVGFAAVPVQAQTAGQPDQTMPGMAPMAQSQPGQQSQGKSGCCCQNMAMMHAPQTPQPPRAR
jgi:hypothetical protein